MQKHSKLIFFPVIMHRLSIIICYIQLKGFSSDMQLHPTFAKMSEEEECSYIGSSYRNNIIRLNQFLPILFLFSNTLYWSSQSATICNSLFSHCRPRANWYITWYGGLTLTAALTQKPQRALLGGQGPDPWLHCEGLWWSKEPGISG